MYLQKLNLLNFKNYEEAELTFIEGVNCLVGNNGAGKTNILDAIHYLSFCKSYFNPADSQNIKIDEPFFMIQGEFNSKGNGEMVYCSVKRGQRKVFKLNQQEYEKLSDHIGLFPLVIITPNDSLLITEGSEERRRFIDTVVSQYDKAYLNNLITYNRVLAQRNAQLKQFATSGRFDASLMELWDEQMEPLAIAIHRVRMEFIEQFNPVFQKHYDFIASSEESVRIGYESRLNDAPMSQLLKDALQKDRNFHYTTVGVHKDDLEFRIRDLSVKKYGSQGQQKSFLIALKLAQFELIALKTGITPLLLLDDIFDKLDELRIKKLMELVSRENFSQIFITDTYRERINSIFKSINVEPKIVEISKGEVKAG